MDLTQWSLVALISAIAGVAGGVFAFNAPVRSEMAVRVVLGAPLASGLTFAAIFFVLGAVYEVPRAGVLGALGVGLYAGLLYGFGAALYGAPAAIIGAVFGAWLRQRRLRAKRRRELGNIPLDTSRFE